MKDKYLAVQFLKKAGLCTFNAWLPLADKKQSVLLLLRYYFRFLEQS